MASVNRIRTIYSTTGSIVQELSSLRNDSSGKATLANLRSSLGKPLSQSIPVWPLVFDYLPEEFLSQNGHETYEEKAILTTLQLFALHQQGQKEDVCQSNEGPYPKNIGGSLSALRKEEDSIAVDRRFNRMITSESFDELSYYLRQMIRLLKSKTSETVNYPQLAVDLYRYLLGDKERVRIAWATAYYYEKKSNQEGEENNE